MAATVAVGAEIVAAVVTGKDEGLMIFYVK